MILCVLLLVIGQVSLMQHQLNDDQHVRGNLCTVCLAAHSLNGALPACASLLIVLAKLLVPLDTKPEIAPVSRTPARLVARSPPAIAIQI